MPRTRPSFFFANQSKKQHARNTTGTRPEHAPVFFKNQSKKQNAQNTPKIFSEKMKQNQQHRTH